MPEFFRFAESLEISLQISFDLLPALYNLKFLLDPSVSSLQDSVLPDVAHSTDSPKQLLLLTDVTYQIAVKSFGKKFPEKANPLKITVFNDTQVAKSIMAECEQSYALLKEVADFCEFALPLIKSFERLSGLNV